MARAAKQVGVLVVDRELVVTGWDAWLTDVTGVAKAQALGQPLTTLFPEVEERGLTARIRHVIDEGVVDVLAPAFHQFLIRCAAPRDQSFYTEMQQHVTLSPLRDARGIQGAAITIEDVTERCVHERALAAQLLDESHEVRLRAARRIADTSDDASPLLPALGDDNWQVRRIAAAGVAQHSHDDLIERLVSAIEQAHKDIGLLNAALSALTVSKADAVPALLRILKRDDPNVRLYAALTLGNMRDLRAVGPLLDLLADEDVNVRFHAIEALGRIAASEALPDLISIVEQRDPYLAFAALDALASIGDAAAIANVTPLLDDPLLGPAAVDALGAFGNEQAAGPLVAVIASDQLSSGAVCRALQQITHRLQDEFGEGQLIADLVRNEMTPEAGAAILRGIPRATDAELDAIAEVLGWLEFDGIAPTLAALLANEHARKTAQTALIRMGRRATQVLIEQLHADDADVRRASAVALGAIGDRAAVAPLASMLEDDDADIVIAAAAALGAIGDSAEFHALLSLLSHRDAAVRATAVAAVNSIGHADTVQAILPLLSSPEAIVREGAVRIAGYFGYIDCLPQVIALTRDTNESVRRTAVEHLAYFDDPRAADAISQSMAQDGPSVRAAAARSFTHLSKSEAAPRIEASLNDPDPRVRYHAALAAGAHTLISTSARLRDMLQKDADMLVRIAAAQALGELRDEAAADQLAALATHPEADLACAAIGAIARLQHPIVAATLRRVLREGDERRQLCALAATRGNVPESLVPELRVLAEASPDPVVARAALDAMTHTGTIEAIDAALAMTTNAQRRADCISALASVPERDVGRVARGLRHPDPRVRRATVESLSRMKRSAASRALTFSLSDDDPAVQFATVQALGRLDMMVE